jgi:hypothetical protein
VGYAIALLLCFSWMSRPSFGAPSPAPEALVTPAPIDKLCIRAPSHIAEFNAAVAHWDLRKIAAAANGIVLAYHLCEADARVAPQPEEPGINYFVARQAQYMVVEGRCYAALGDAARALQAFKDSDHLAEMVAEWIPTSVGLNGRNTDRRPSMYKPAALDIRAADAYEIAKLQSRRQSRRPGVAPTGPAPAIREITEPPSSPEPSPPAASPPSPSPKSETPHANQAGEAIRNTLTRNA